VLDEPSRERRRDHGIGSPPAAYDLDLDPRGARNDGVARPPRGRSYDAHRLRLGASPPDGARTGPLDPGRGGRFRDQTTPLLVENGLSVYLCPCVWPDRDRHVDSPRNPVSFVATGCTVGNGRGRFRTCDYVGPDLDYVDGLMPAESLADAMPKGEIEAIEAFRAPFGAPSRSQGTSMWDVIPFWARSRQGRSWEGAGARTSTFSSPPLSLQESRTGPYFELFVSTGSRRG